MPFPLNSVAELIVRPILTGVNLTMPNLPVIAWLVLRVPPSLLQLTCDSVGFWKEEDQWMIMEQKHLILLKHSGRVQLIDPVLLLFTIATGKQLPNIPRSEYI
jgi:hypothetical protein